MGFGIGFDVMQGFVYLIFAVVIMAFIVFFIKGISTWHKNNNSPRLTVRATVVSKRQNTDVHHHHNDGAMHTSTSTTYYATFQFDSGDRLELHIPGREYGMLAEGDIGELTFQGTRYLGFQRRTAGAAPTDEPPAAETPRYTEKKSWDPEL